MQRFAGPTGYNVFGATKKLPDALNRFEHPSCQRDAYLVHAARDVILLSYLAACIWHGRVRFRSPRRARKVCINGGCRCQRGRP